MGHESENKKTLYTVKFKKTVPFLTLLPPFCWGTLMSLCFVSLECDSTWKSFSKSLCDHVA